MKITPRAIHLLILILVSISGAAVKAAESGSLACNEIQVFVRDGCPFCQRARIYLDQLQTRYPELVIRESNIDRSSLALSEFIAINEQRHIRQPGVPTFNFCSEVLVGFQGEESTGSMIERIVTGRQESVSESLAARIPLFGDVNP